MITIETAKRVLEVVDAGLCSGLGTPEPGRMCIEAAVCFALGEPHSDEPSCVSPAVRAFKIRLNDSSWSSNTARAVGMRKLAVAQLGSKGAVDEVAFCKQLAKLTIQRVLPLVLRSVGLSECADRCKSEGSEASARAAYTAAAADYANYTAATAAAATAAAARSAANAANAANVADYAANAAAAARSAANAARSADADEILTISADVCLDALRFVNAPGVALLDELGL